MEKPFVDIVIVLVAEERSGEPTCNTLKSRPATRAYTDGWDRVFGGSKPVDKSAMN